MAISLGELAVQFGCELVGDPSVQVATVATLASADGEAVCFFSSKAFLEDLRSTSAGAVVLRSADAGECPGRNLLLAADPYLVFAQIATVLFPLSDIVAGIHPSASIARTAVVSSEAQVSALVVVEDDAIVDKGVYLGPGSYVGSGCRIGRDSRILCNAVLYRDVVVGERCIVHPGAVIGSDGFGNAQGDDGWVKVPQLGKVRVGNDVEIGANTTIDRGALDDTVIGDGVRLDNLVHIAHNVRIGAHTALAAQTGIAGSTIVGERCLFAGQVGVVGHLNIGDDVVIGGKATVTKDITEPGVYNGTFAVEKDRIWKRRVARFRRLSNLAARVAKLEKREKDNGSE